MKKKLYLLAVLIVMLSTSVISRAQSGQYSTLRFRDTVPSSCTTGNGGIYWNITTKQFYACPTTNVWVPVGSVPINYLQDAAGVSTPTTGTLSTSTTGGSLTDATTYYYRVSAVTNSGETLASTEVSELTGSGGNTNTVTIPWSIIPGATGYKVYCRTTGAELLCATITDPTTVSWTDDGSVTPSGALPTTDTSGDSVLSLGTSRIEIDAAPNRAGQNIPPLYLHTDATSIPSGNSFRSMYIDQNGNLSSTSGNQWGFVVSQENTYPVASSGRTGSVEANAFYEFVTGEASQAIDLSGVSTICTVCFSLTLTGGAGGSLHTGASYGMKGIFGTSSGTVTVDNLYGLSLSESNSGTPTFTNIYGISLDNLVGQTAYGINLGTVQALSGGGNAYGLKIGNVTSSSGTAYGIYTGTGLNHFGGIVDGISGFNYNSTATTGRFLRGNGTAYVASSGAASGTGSCTNQFVTATNDDAAPTCTTATLASAQYANQGTTTTVLHGNAAGNPSFGPVTGSDMTSGTVTSTQLATANKTIAKSVVIISPTTSNTNQVQWYYGQAVTLTRVACSTNTGTVTIQLDKRAEGTPNTAGTDAMTSTLSCSTTTATTTSFSSSSVSADSPLNLQITATSGTPGVVRIHLDATIN